MSRDSSGFTLIEVLIVLVVTSLLMTIGVAQYRGFARRQEVVVGKRLVVTDLREVQKNATTGSKPEGCTTDLVGYAFEVTSVGPPAQYDIYALCLNPGNPDNRFDIKTVTLGNSVALSIPSVNPVIFRPLALGTNILAGQSSTFTVSNPDVSANSSTISIYYTGEIE